MKRLSLYASALLTLLLLFSSCGGRKKALLPNVSGKAGEVVVVMDRACWDGPLGGCLRDHLAADCPFLPQREPLYTLVEVPPTAFSSLFQLHRNLILCDVSPRIDSARVRFGNDVWATPQCVVRINAPDEATAVRLATDNMEHIINFIETAERNRVIENTVKYQEASIRPPVKKVFGGSPYFPSGYVLKKITDDFAWIAYETTYVQQDILLYKFPAERTGRDFSLETLLEHRNAACRDNIPGMFENTWMTTSSFATPSLNYVKYQGRHFAELRGYWEVHNDFMGGPFVSHSFYSEDGSEVITVEAFVYAPKYNKRHYLRQVESLLYSWSEE
ncbi:MAG: DUF4837 family protein [Bacteroidales bacterium]|nr:DUF4837 family protein [Bacteroidales bacterium]